MMDRGIPIHRRVGERLEEARTEAGLTQDEVAARTGLKQYIVGRYETGARMIPVDDLATLAEFFSRPISWFVGETTDQLVRELTEGIDPTLLSLLRRYSFATQRLMVKLLPAIIEFADRKCDEDRAA